ncbi:MAG: hypothetical protein IPP87_00320 [Ideonella sp.]|nr:hypothetical protein [Ideonella sp.]MBL0147249.1 hypothetical protein [Ideonella sp.]
MRQIKLPIFCATRGELERTVRAGSAKGCNASRITQKNQFDNGNQALGIPCIGSSIAEFEENTQ